MSARTGLDLIVHCADDPTLTGYGSDERYFSDDDVLLARAELTHLRACESWILEHAQHGARCPAPDATCTCGLAKIMEEME